MRLGIVLVLRVLAGAFAAAGCSSTGRLQPYAFRTPDPSTTCPLGIRGARIAMTNTKDGVALAVRAYGDVEEVRRRVREAANVDRTPEVRRSGTTEDASTGGEDRSEPRGRLGLADLGVAVVAEAQNTPTGATLLVRPQDPADLDRMRKALVKRERRVREARCS